MTLNNITVQFRREVNEENAHYINVNYFSWKKGMGTGSETGSTCYWALFEYTDTYSSETTDQELSIMKLS